MDQTHHPKPPSLKLALFGYGKMGEKIEARAKALGHEIVAIYDQNEQKGNLDEADVCIDFSHPDAVIKHIQMAISLQKNMVIGTTGWDEKRKEIENRIDQANVGLIWAPNFSIGMQLFTRLATKAAELMAPFEAYDLAGFEVHHKHKVDKPSGTALHLENAISAVSKWQTIPFSSVRVGSVPGTHTLVFDSPADQITLTHTARSRDGFVEGALMAASWIARKKGFYTLNDLIDEVFICN